MFKKILIALAAVVIVFLAVAAFQSPDCRISRSAVVAAPPATVFEQINDYHKWVDWSPWAKMDPAMKQTFEGPPAGTGAIYSWAGNSKVGEGRMTITESDPAKRVSMRLEFLKPFAATNTAEFTLAPEANGTRVTWTMIGKKNFAMKAMGLLMNMDKLVGADFEKGLSNLKEIVEKK
ncbi:SRPBCC family protein [Luteolibacter ambystomatis]|uniref:SRPBCC family protein n=1 Tax=Luteolibacter ambystomatis TaxID=2824561 RepID=A0A975J104_9BACT|nr:SRPBCC family protein [Luteolibacter ambystomatis]QUE52041.1 SRPBCC family protein [Luteolibacter ambystomatis]